MTRIGSHLDAIEAWLAALQHQGAALVVETRRQLDLVDAEDMEKVSFRSPAGFLVLPRFRLVPRPDGGRDAQIWIVIAIAARGSLAKPMDEDVIDRAITLAAALDDQDFGQAECSPATDVEARPVLQAGIETKGLALVAVSFQQTLYRVTAPNVFAAQAFGAGGQTDGAPALLEGLLESGLTPEEQAIVDTWNPAP